VSCRSKRAADSDLDTDRLTSKQTTDAYSIEVDGNSEPTPLSDSKVKSRQSSYRWAVYVGPSATGHIWRCSVCDKSRKGREPATYRFKDAHEFNRHHRSTQHKQAEEARALAEGFQDARDSFVAERISFDIDAAGKLLIIVAFMVANGVSLRLFPQVCFPGS
jgi:hypothetical protein